MTPDAAAIALFDSLIPLGALQPLTDEALYALPEWHLRRGAVALYAFPFRIGRESRLLEDPRSGQLARLERYRPSGPVSNDLYLVDAEDLLSISREHLQIERSPEGFVVRDRGSACGFLVDGQHVGGEHLGGSCPLRHGQELTLGWKDSPFRYRFLDFGTLAAAARHS